MTGTGEDLSAAELHDRIEAQRCVRLTGKSVFQRVVDHVVDSSVGEIELPIGEPPKGLTDDEFMDQVGAEVIDALDAANASGRIGYDHEASRRLTHEMADDPRAADGVQLVFKRIAEAV